MKKRFIVLKYSLVAIVAFLILFFLMFGLYSIVYAKKIHSNQYAAGQNFGGKTKDQAKSVLFEKAKPFAEKPIGLSYLDENGNEQKEYEIKPEELGLHYEIDRSVDILWRYGRNDNIFKAFWEQLLAFVKRTDHDMAIVYNEEALNKKISEIAIEIDQPEKDYSIQYEGDKFVLNTERQEGRRVDQEELKQNILKNIYRINSNSISFKIKVYKPRITEENANKKLVEANEILKFGEIDLVFEDQHFKADLDSIAAFIVYETNIDDLKLKINNDRIKVFVDTLAKSLNVEAKNAKLGVVNGQATIIEVATLGKTLDQIQTAVDIENTINARVKDRTSSADPRTISLKVETKKPEITSESIGELGIVELIGTGTTDFKKSPANRIHNIKIGANAINGALIKQGETFSTLGRLGKIDASSGYLEELVIKENRTVPEFGGGLCQVSSTLFRATLNAGLKIVERQNHKYRVSYYEPPVGMDATIYDPAPDFKFTNNYSKHILIQSRVEGTKITFDIYGTKDGRSVTISEPEMYDIVEPEAPIMVETDTLPPGEKKQIEKAHQGASTKFSYKVIRGEETLQEKIFTSKYVAWPEKWLVGKGAPPVPAEAPAPAPAPEATPAT